MPPKSVSSCSVYSMPHERQVELLSEALLREYMHKRRFTETLRVFDTENPRDADTISSRALMSDLMALDPGTQKSLKTDGIETIMEMLCCLRVRRRLELEALKQRALAEVPKTPQKAKKSSKKAKWRAAEMGSSDAFLREELDGCGGVGREKNHFSCGCGNSSSSSSSSGASNRDVTGGSNIIGFSGDAGTKNAQECDSVADLDIGATNLGKGLVRSIIRLLCGENLLPTAFAEHGFYFLEEVDYGLCQEGSGLDGIMAAVQAFICACFFRNTFIDVKQHQEQCLLKAFMTLILNAQPDPRSVCLVDGLIRAESVEADMMRLRLWRDFSTTQEVEKVLCSLLEERWRQPKGSGVFCFLLSVLLSKGIREVSSMMVCSKTLIDSKGRCSSDLTRLLLRAAAGAPTAGNAFGSWMMRVGNSGGMMCGYVSSGSDDSILDGEGAKTPQFPVWVLHHEGRCVVLFLKLDDRSQFERKKKLGRTISSNVYFYGFAMPERCEMFLTVSLNAAAETGQPMESYSSFIYDAVRRIPIWSHGEVDLNGFDPPF